MAAPSIRKARPDDADTVRTVCSDAFRLTSFHTDPLIPATCRDRIVWTLYAEPAFRRPRPPCLVAEVSNTVVGFLLYGGYADLSRAIGRPVSNIILLAVRPDHQNRGIGRRLLEAGLDLFHRRRTRLVTVGTDANNTPALRLYTSLGFRPVLHWRTWRLRLAPSPVSGIPPTSSPDPSLLPPGPGHLLLSSFLEDASLHPALQETVRHNLTGQKPSPASVIIPSGPGLTVFEPHGPLSGLCGAPFLRLAAFHLSDLAQAPAVLTDGLRHLAAHLSATAFIETFLKTGHPLETPFRASGFRPVHEAVTLHLPLM